LCWPAAAHGNRNWPESPLSVVSLPSSVTLALGMIAPVESRTTPSTFEPLHGV
jgi:hypothetical protein